MKILLVEDELKVNRFIKKGLEENGFFVEVAFDGLSGVRMACTGLYDLILLDIVLPKVSGLEVCQQIREAYQSVPILMLTALGTTEDKIRGLDTGADDYLTKPFHFEELLARIRALSRRNNLESDSVVELQVDDLIINLDSKEVARGPKGITLTLREFQLLELLARNKGRVLSRVVIAEKIWDQSFDSGSNVIDVYINYLRKKIDSGHDKKLLHTVVGMGYVLRE
ncbi:MAG: response regulator transcription factor [Balneolales bacterium]|nr:response regulator transcription factor [Balneolales bacterium]